ncbi:FAD-binding oxidoreductase [Pseudomonas sp. zfem002]|uniref:NAD(P)/FAD-dependent oxidoreductase n=1 Tax=Pseudomonas sp. zfem002 TaxID=3078197 RepID=UPI00292844A1|nr:FAD-binding oxidoreductase [Pseudomonas sp. zfem002]MDU9391364.1 FAD-binding oxidoreductase [Pseudomonas sp. zfem002]
MHCQTIVLGAGIVGVSTALHLQARGRKVVLIDRDEPGSGTSHGNAGLIERSSVIPYSFPRQLSKLARYGLNQQSDVRFSWRYLPKVAPWLLSYWRNSAPAPLAEATRAMLPLVQRCVEEHDQLIEAAGAQALVKANGWIEVYREEAAFAAAKADAESLRAYGLAFEILDRQQLHAREGDLSQGAIGGIHWLDPKTVSNPSALVRAYVALFVQRGGQFIHGDARSLRQVGSDWQVDSRRGPISAEEVVIALGPQAAELFKPLGYRIPLEIKRGYHAHYRARPGAHLNHSICDAQAGYVLAPMEQGIRLTTGIEFAASDDAANEIQLQRCEAVARGLFPLGERIDETPWLGRRPCLPDMRPVIGPASRHKGLWFNFGHAHHGLTLGPVSGRLLAEMMTGATPFTDPAPYSAERFH